MGATDKKRTALVVGGSSGIGLAVVRALLARGRHVCVLARHAPEPELLPAGDWEFIPTDLRYYDEALFDRLSGDGDVDTLFISAGFGRLACFEDLHPAEIKTMTEVNTSVVLRLVRQFYGRIKCPERFYCGLVSSIAGLVSSPMFSAYAATKAALCRFAESVNIELEAAGVTNRILNVAPGSVPGTRFNGGENDPALLGSLGEDIADRLLAGETLYIPNYEPTYRGVLERYAADGHAFGLDSYRYKQQSGRVRADRSAVVGYLSGTFDLFHIGHLNLLRRARAECDHLIVGVHESGSWKGKVSFIPFEERMAIVGACQYVDRVVTSPVEDSEAWELYRFDKLFVGSDYQGTERFNRYEEFFRDKGVQIVYFPYTRGTSSTQLRAVLEKNIH